MPDRDDEDHEDAIVDLVHDTVVTGTHAPLTCATGKFLGAGWARFGSKQLDRGLHASTGRGIEFAHLT
jgi:hypothetical protein